MQKAGRGKLIGFLAGTTDTYLHLSNRYNKNGIFTKAEGRK